MIRILIPIDFVNLLEMLVIMTQDWDPVIRKNAPPRKLSTPLAEIETVGKCLLLFSISSFCFPQFLTSLSRLNILNLDLAIMYFSIEPRIEIRIYVGRQLNFPLQIAVACIRLINFAFFYIKVVCVVCICFLGFYCFMCDFQLWL